MNPSQKSSIIVVDDFHPVFLDKLNGAGLEVRYEPGFDPAWQMAELSAYDIIAVRSKLFFDAPLMDALPNLACIARGGAGMDNIDEAYAVAKGITLLNAPEGNRDAVADHTLGLLLNLSKNISRSFNEVRSFVWKREENRGWELGGKTVGLVGFGNAGSTVAARLSGFGCRIIAFDKYKSFSSVYAAPVSLEELLRQSDIISFHVPLSTETRGFLNAGMLSAMKNGVVLINTSRGGICKTADVWEGIKSGKVKAFAADVLEHENMDTLTDAQKQLLQNMMLSNQVIITPHVAGWSVESYRRIAEVLSEKIIEYTTNVKNIRMKVD